MSRSGGDQAGQGTEPAPSSRSTVLRLTEPRSVLDTRKRRPKKGGADYCGLGGRLSFVLLIVNSCKMAQRAVRRGVGTPA